MSHPLPTPESLPLDTELSQEWFLEARLNLPTDTPFEELMAVVERSYIGLTQDDAPFITKHIDGVDVIDIVAMYPMVGTQEAVLRRTTERFLRMLGGQATAAGIESVKMNVDSLSYTGPDGEATVPAEKIDIIWTSLTRDEEDMDDEDDAAGIPMMDVTEHARRLLVDTMLRQSN